MTSESFASSLPSLPVSMAFRDCGGAAFKMQRPLAPRRQLRPPKRLPPPPPLQSSPRRRWCREGGTGTASEVGRREARAADDRACKNYQEFFIASFPPLFIASLCAPHGGSKLKALACASNKQHMLCHIFHLRTTSFFITCLQSHRRLSQKAKTPTPPQQEIRIAR